MIPVRVREKMYPDANALAPKELLRRLLSEEEKSFNLEKLMEYVRSLKIYNKI